MSIFDTVAAMKLAVLLEGQFVSTGGYYALGDGGGATYLVAASQAVDGLGDHTLANGTVALIQGEVTAANYGAKVGPADATPSFLAAYNAVGGRGNIPLGDGDYLVTIATIPTTGLVSWIGRNTTINGSIDPNGLPGTFLTYSDDTDPDNGEYLRLYTGDTTPATAANFGRAMAWIMTRETGGTGNSEQVTLINDVGTLGNVNEFLVALKATATTNSTGNVFGMNPTGESGVSAATSVEVSACEGNVTILSATVARKAIFQAVETAACVGQGSAISASYFATKQTGGAGVRDCLSIGSESSGTTPLIEGFFNLGAGVRFHGVKEIQYGIDFGQIQMTIGIQFAAQRVGHKIAWGKDGGGGSENGIERGVIQSDCTLDEGGAFIFTNGGMTLQAFNTGPSRSASIEIDGVTDASNPLSVRIGGNLKRVTEGVADSGGAGFKLLRVAN